MRLIDADAFDSAFTDLRFNADGTLAHWGDRPDWCLHGSEVEKLIENAPTIGVWISVKERLPDAAGYECLVCAVNENTNQTHIFTAFTGYGEPGWWTSNVHYMSEARSPRDNSVHPALKITHWMPIPEGPKGDD